MQRFKLITRRSQQEKTLRVDFWSLHLKGGVSAAHPIDVNDDANRGQHSPVQSRLHQLGILLHDADAPLYFQSEIDRKAANWGVMEVLQWKALEKSFHFSLRQGLP